MTDVNILPDGRVSRKEAARYLGYKPKTLAEWARRDRGPRGWLVGGRVFYDFSELKAFAAGGKTVN